MDDKKCDTKSNDLNRRQFCAAAGAGGLLALALPACGSANNGTTGDGMNGSISDMAGNQTTGGSDMANGASDMANGASDMANGAPDMAHAQCPTTNVINAGPFSALQTNQVSIVMDPQQNKYFVCRNNSGVVYALSAICPHNCCQVQFDANNQRFACPCHGSTFSYDGTNLSGPASGAPLQKLSVCKDSNGDAIVELVPSMCIPHP